VSGPLGLFGSGNPMPLWMSDGDDARKTTAVSAYR